jgi:homoserine kinase
LGCALSGAGPAILVFYETGKRAAVEAVSREFEKVGTRSEIMFSDLDRPGLVITSGSE